jgi:hypothetical protein
VKGVEFCSELADRLPGGAGEAFGHDGVPEDAAILFEQPPSVPAKLG